MTLNAEHRRIRWEKYYATAMGRDFDKAFKSKRHWNARAGMMDGVFVDLNEPMQSDYLAAAGRVIGIFRDAPSPQSMFDTMAFASGGKGE